VKTKQDHRVHKKCMHEIVSILHLQSKQKIYCSSLSLSRFNQNISCSYFRHIDFFQQSCLIPASKLSKMLACGQDEKTQGRAPLLYHHQRKYYILPNTSTTACYDLQPSLVDTHPLHNYGYPPGKTGFSSYTQKRGIWPEEQ